MCISMALLHICILPTMVHKTMLKNNLIYDIIIISIILLGLNNTAGLNVTYSTSNIHKQLVCVFSYTHIYSPKLHLALIVALYINIVH